MENKRTCLYDKHVALGALISPFGGFDMPIQYTDIKDEHNAVRTACGVFDVSHMGEVIVSGADAERYVNHIFTNDVTDMPAGKIIYGMMLYENGGTVDDLLVYKIDDDTFFLVINASNINKDWEWMQSHTGNFDVSLKNVSDDYGQIAVQGPKAEDIVENILGLPCAEMAFYTSKVLAEKHLMNNEEPYDTASVKQPLSMIISRTGYTGEDGFEIYGSHECIRAMWDKLMKSGRCKPCGLGCRDTLRFEVGLPLYGDELSEDISPIMAGLGMFCKPDRKEFIGREALLKQKAEGVSRKITGIELADKAIPRHGYKVLKNGEIIGEVTTGYHTISTDKSVCMALIDTAHAVIGTPVEIQIRKKIFPGKVVKKIFYDKHYKK